MKIFGIVIAALCASIIAGVATGQITITPPPADIHINGHTYTVSQWQANPIGTLSAIANDVGAITQAYPQGRFSPRVVLTSSLTMYVGGGGASDSNNCLVGSPCATIQRPFDLLRDRYDLAGHIAVVQLADGVYSAGAAVYGNIQGQLYASDLILRGNVATPSAVTISDTRALPNNTDGPTGNPIFVAYGGQLTVQGVRLVSSYRSVWSHERSNVFLGNVDFGAAGDAQIAADAGSEVRIFSNYSVSAGAPSHMFAVDGGSVYTYDPGNTHVSISVTITGTPTFNFYALALNQGHITSAASNTSFSGGINGLKYGADGLALINTQGSGVNFFPGSCPCVLTNGSIYK